MRAKGLYVLASLIAAATIAVQTGAAQAKKPPGAESLIEKSINAFGGIEKLKRYQAFTFKDKGTYFGMGEGLPYTGEYAFQLPNKFKMEIHGVFTIALNGDKGWMSQGGGEPQEVKGEALKELKEQAYGSNVESLVPLVGGKGYKLSVIGESEVGGKKVIGVRVSHAGRRDIELYFDKKTHLLVMTARSVKDMEQGGKLVRDESHMLSYMTVDGMKVPKKVLIKRDGKKYVETEFHDYALKEKLPDSVFAMPKTK